MELNSKRLASSYLILTEALRKWGAEFIPANAGLFVFAKLGNKVTDWEEEMAVVKLLEDSGVIVSPGKRFDGAPEEKGWVRITFAVPQEVLEEAVRRIETCLPLFDSSVWSCL
jgi:gliotoxin/aspirochlorine biosynthesis aminotransferase